MAIFQNNLFLNSEIIYFKDFDKLQSLSTNIEKTLLLTKLGFHFKNSKISKKGKIWTSRTKNEMASWFNLKEGKVSKYLEELEKNGLIEKKNFKWNGSRQSHINVKIKTGYINFKLLEDLFRITNNHRESIILLKLIYHTKNSKIKIGNKIWCARSKENLSTWAGVSIRTTDKLINSLTKKGLIIKKIYKFNGSPTLHFHIPEPTIELLNSFLASEKKHGKYPQQNCRIKSAKNEVPIKRKMQKKNTNNITVKNLPSTKGNIQKDFSRSDIILSNMKLKRTLTEKQKRYLSSALQRTIQRYRISVSSQKELLNQLMFTITNPKQMKGVKTFTHAVSRCMAILRSGNWKTPIGFYNHDETGRAIKDTRTESQQNWEEIKRNEISSKGQSASIQSLIEQRQKHAEKEFLTYKALDVAAQVVSICKTKLDDSHMKSLTDGFIHQLNELFGRGADKDKTLSWLKSNMAKT